MKQDRSYRSYLLRLWQERHERGYIWRASLESPGTGKRQGFATLHELFEFLQGEMAKYDQGGAHSKTD